MFMKETLDLTGHGSIIVDQYQTKIHFVDDNLSSMTLSSHSRLLHIQNYLYDIIQGRTFFVSFFFLGAYSHIVQKDAALTHLGTRHL